MTKQQVIYLHDGSFEGMLTAVAVAIKSKNDVEGVFSEQHYTRSLFAEVYTIETDQSQAMRFFQYFGSLKGKASLLAIDGFLSENDEVATHLYSMVCACLRHGAEVLNRYTHDSVHFLDKLSRKVRREAHRFNGLVRFRVLENGLQYGPFEPDYNVIGYCGQHFRKRLAAVSWLLHDVRRNQALYCPDLSDAKTAVKLWRVGRLSS